jgi:hypothetical protein
MWLDIQEVNAVWYFDATGCVIKDIIIIIIIIIYALEIKRQVISMTAGMIR